MKTTTEIAIEKYPPKGMADPHDWEHDENAELRKAFMAGYEVALNELMQSINPNHYNNVKKMAEEMNAQTSSVNTAMQKYRGTYRVFSDP